MEEKFNKLNSIKKICRTCLTENGDLRNIFDSIDPNLKTQTSNMLTACTSLQTDNNDGLPPTICFDCETRLRNAFDFRELALKSYVTLKNYLSLDKAPTSQVSNVDGFIEANKIKIEIKDEPFETNSNYERSEEDERSEPENKKIQPKPKTEAQKNERGGSRIRTAVVDPLEVNQVLAESKKRECCQCGFSSLTARGLSLHISHIHKKDVKADNNMCNVCGKSFRLATKLRLHMRIHTGDTPYSCQFCKKFLRTQSQLIEHERTHTGEKPHICHICGRRFAQLSVFNTHMRIHTGRPEECMECGQRFCRPTELRLHMRKHTGEKPFLCTKCGQGFFQMSHLKGHLETHSDERAYQCPHCSRAFKQKKSLRSHILIHSDEKPYRCSECPYRCRRKDTLTQHMRTHSKTNAK